VNLEFDCFSQGRLRKGTIQDIIPQGNEQARTFPVQIHVPNEDFSILAGMSCRVRFPVGEQSEALLVHKDAVVTTGLGHHIFVVRDGKAFLVPVKKGQSYGSLVVVEGKVSVEDRVVVEGNERLQPKEEVNPISRKESS
jgi:multidrug efflux pump subunit AcrA (membrane-fusion protein)